MLRGELVVAVSFGEGGRLGGELAGLGAARGVEGSFELADEEVEAGEFGGGGRRQLRFNAGGEERGFADKRIADEGPIGARRPSERRGVERGDGAGVGGGVEVGARESGGVLAEGGAAFRVGEEALAQIGEFGGRAGFREHGFAAVLHEEREIGGREDDGFTGGEELGEFRRETVIVERTGVAGLDEDVGEREQLGQAGLGDEAEVEDEGAGVERERSEERRGIKAGADEARGRAALIQESDGEVEFAHLGLVRERVGAGKNENFFLGEETEFFTQSGGGRAGFVEIKIDGRREELRWDAGGDVFFEALDDMRDAVGYAEKRLVAERMREAVDEPAVGLGGTGGAKCRERLARVGLDEVALAVFEMDENAGGSGEGALVGEDELADAFAGRPSVDHIGGAGVGKQAGFGEEFVVGGRDKQRLADGGDRGFTGRDRDDAGVAGGAEGVGEAGDVVEAVGGEVAVVDEEDIHGGAKGYGRDDGRGLSRRGAGLTGGGISKA